MLPIKNYLKKLLIDLRGRALSFLFNLLKNRKLSIKSNRLLIVRLDAIGDYILFRNFIHALKEHPIWKSYKITLLGNVGFKEIAENFDDNVISDFIWIDTGALSSPYFFQMLTLKLKLNHYDVIINPVHSRFEVLDQLIHYAGGKWIIGSNGDSIRYPNEAIKIASDKLYNQLIPSLSYHHFEFLRNKYFFDSLLSKISDIKLSISSSGNSPYLDVSYFNVLIFPGAGAAYRQWSPDNFSQVMLLLKGVKLKREIRFYILGGRPDIEISKSILANHQEATDLTGKTTLKGLVDIIASGDLLLSNETSAVHIAAATKTPTVCISNGNHFGRFNPYPSEIGNKIVTLYPFEHFYTADEKQRIDIIVKYKLMSDLNINLIEPLKVFHAILPLIENDTMKA